MRGIAIFSNIAWWLCELLFKKKLTKCLNDWYILSTFYTKNNFSGHYYFQPNVFFWKWRIEVLTYSRYLWSKNNRFVLSIEFWFLSPNNARIYSMSRCMRTTKQQNRVEQWQFYHNVLHSTVLHPYLCHATRCTSFNRNEPNKTRRIMMLMMVTFWMRFWTGSQYTKTQNSYTQQKLICRLRAESFVNCV